MPFPDARLLTDSINRPTAALQLSDSDGCSAPLVAAAQAGDLTAFDKLYDAHESQLYALCMGLTADRAAAAELVQDTFVQAWKGLATFRGESAFATWLHRIAVNQLLMNERSRRRRSLRVAIEADLALPETDQHSPRTLATVPALERDTPLALDLERAIERLPEGARAVFVLREIAGYSHAEIGEQLGIAEGTSKAHLFRARRLLRGFLRP